MPCYRLVSSPRVWLGVGHFDHNPRFQMYLSAASSLITRRKYHDESFGFRKRQEYVFPDCVPFFQISTGL